MRLKWLLILLIVIIFSGGRVALAAQGNHFTKNHGNSEQKMKGMDMSVDKNSDSQDMEGMDMSGDHSKDSHDDMEGMDMGHEPIVEKPANLKVLGTYGAVNLSFIMIGVWNKWFRRKGELSGHSK